MKINSISKAVTIAMLTAGAAVPAVAATSFGVSADALLMTYSGTTLDYAYLDVAPQGTGLQSLEPGSDAGFRLNLDMADGDFRWLLAATSFSSDEEGELVDPSASSTGTLYNDDLGSVSNGSIGHSTAKWELDYTNVDLGAGFQLHPGQRLSVEILAGLRILDTSEEYDVYYANSATAPTNVDNIDQDFDVQGYGLYIGMAPSYSFNNNVKLVGSFSISPIAADIDRHFVYATDGTVEVDLKDSFKRNIISTTMSLGVETQVLDMLTIGAGYESTTLQGYPEFMKHTSESGETVIDHGDTNAGLSGFYVRVGGRF